MAFLRACLKNRQSYAGPGRDALRRVRADDPQVVPTNETSFNAIFRQALKWKNIQRARGTTVWLALFALTLFWGETLRAQPTYPPVEAGVKAGYLYNFTKYTEWPAGAFTNSTAPIVIGVLGDDPFGAVLDQTVTNRLSQDRKVVIRRERDVKTLLDCQVVFISRSEKNRLPAILATLRHVPVLTVCDDDAFFQLGVMIKYSRVKETVRFEVKLDPAERAGIKFGSGMLGSAMRVWPKSGGEVKQP